MRAVETEALRRQSDEALTHALADPAKAAIARVAWQMIIDGKSEEEVRGSIGKKRHSPKVDLAEQRRVAVETNFRTHGHAVSVPKPDASNTDIKRWRREGCELFYRPATAELRYGAWMHSVGQGEHFTVAEEANRGKTKVGWEDAAAGYWFVVRIAQACANWEGKSWTELMTSFRSLSLEEYAIVFWMHYDLTGECFNSGRFRCILRTRYGLGAFQVHEWGIDRGMKVEPIPDPSFRYMSMGGRDMKMLANAA